MGNKKVQDVGDEVGDAHLCEPWRHEQYNDWKFNIKETDQEDAEIIKDLDWQATHRKWDEDYYCWTVDLDAFFVVYNHLTDAGLEVTVSEDLLKAYGNNRENNTEQYDDSSNENDI